MFDIGFPELLLVSIVALLVIGPERLPETVRTIMIWLNKIKRSFANIKTEIEQEIGVDEIRQQIHNDTIMKELDKGRQQIENVFEGVQQDIQDTQDDIRNPHSEPSEVKPVPEDNLEENNPDTKPTLAAATIAERTIDEPTIDRSTVKTLSDREPK